ncbi:Retinal guanylyl cyclase 1 [Halocaridina rubra]|uniref:guanylate cyclase n=1 Tax=Halocaridina rubra TaxID=373956 RepID=A0AAN9A0W6_HALRR
MHDLRQENVNGFLGMLCDPVRPGFVWEYCSRKSLEDVIRQEDIKLDWSFRLSLLTDLVRGMRYLHGSPIRHHGRLTSRNCVIDARWVLKVTDYGLPAVYDIQNINHPKRPTKG